MHYFYPIKEAKCSNKLSILCVETRPKPCWAQPRDHFKFAHRCICAQTELEPGRLRGLQPQRCAYLIIRSSSWLLFFPPHGCPSTFKRRNTIPPSFQWGPGLFSLSPLLLAVLRGPQQLSLSLCTLTRLASSPSLHLSSSSLLSSHLISSPSFQSFRSSFKPGPRG